MRVHVALSGQKAVGSGMQCSSCYIYPSTLGSKDLGGAMQSCKVHFKTSIVYRSDAAVSKHFC